jgi:hypothetical protein
VVAISHLVCYLFIYFQILCHYANSSRRHHHILLYHILVRNKLCDDTEMKIEKDLTKDG